MEKENTVNRPRKLIILAVLFLGIIAVGARVFLKKTDPHLQAAAFTLPDPDGKLVHSSDFSGQPMLVHFWAAWCAPCTEELPELMEVASGFTKEKLRFLMVSNDPNWGAAMKLVSKGKRSDSLVLLLDPEMKVAGEYGTYQLPETYLVSSSGKILMKWIGPQKWKDEALRKGLEMLLGPQAEPKS